MSLCLDGVLREVSNCPVLSVATVSELLEPFGLVVSAQQGELLCTYLDLLLRWNRKINLTSLTKAEQIIQRHFGESLFVLKVTDIGGRLLDIGSGAGFPGLALKITYPEIPVTLLEPIAKKRAFLKEVARVCRMSGVEVLGERLEDFAGGSRLGAYDVATARAVGRLDSLVPTAANCLKGGGRIALWLGIEQIPAACQAGKDLAWSEPVPIPLSNERVILVGRRV